MSGVKFRGNKYTPQNIFLILVSFSGLLFLLAMYLWSPESTTHYYLQEPIILLLFIVICILGMLAAINPGTCNRFMKFQRKQKIEVNISKSKSFSMPETSISENSSITKNSISESSSVSKSPILESAPDSQSSNIRFEGHHPDCVHFQKHTFLINGKKYCPGCSGLFIGALIAIFGVLFYYFAGLPSLYVENFFWIGAGMVFLALFLIVFINLEKKLKFISNLSLVLGSFFILLGIIGAKDNFLMEIYFIVLIIFWIITRIGVSEEYHENICKNCLEESECVYE